MSGNPRLNLIFTAAIFNQVPGLDPLTKDEMDKAGLIEDDVGDSREESVPSACGSTAWAWRTCTSTTCSRTARTASHC